MLNRKKKFQIIGAIAALLLFASAVGCKGFFVDPVLTSVTVGPTATIDEGKTVQETAVGTFNDGTSKTLSDVQWSSDTQDVATVNSSGVVTGISPGTATITGSSGTVSGTATITVALQNVSSIKVNPTTRNIQANGGTGTFTAIATLTDGSTVDVTATADWTASDVDNTQLTQGVSPETVTVEAAPVGEHITLTASYLSGSGVTFTATATITVTQ